MYGLASALLDQAHGLPRLDLDGCLDSTIDAPDGWTHKGVPVVPNLARGVDNYEAVDDGAVRGILDSVRCWDGVSWSSQGTSEYHGTSTGCCNDQR